LLVSLFLSFQTAVVTLAVHAAAFAYSCPPLRIKKIFILNTMLIAASTILAILLGFSAAGGALSLFPWKFAAALLAALTLAFSTKDVNDYSGDKKYGIATVMTLLGPKKGRLATAALALAGYFILPAAAGSARLFAVSAVLGSATFFAILLPKNKISEPLVFALFFVFAFFFILINPDF
jgi:4-hydroxybenzoate polyprenyltransferase